MDDVELFFESPDVGLSDVPEVFASALLPVAVGRNARLIMDSPPDQQWQRNVERVLAVWHAWWGTAPRLSEILVAGRAGTRRPIAFSPAAGVALCFSLGVDGFYSLLRSGREVDYLLLAEGFDIPLGDRPRIAAAESSLREVALQKGLRPAVVRTNLREHPSCQRKMRWGLRAHGGALAALGHACTRVVRELLISATKPYSAGAPWGSHWETDPGWSSSRLGVTHLGAERRRNDKLTAIQDEPLVRRHLRVCWENRTAAGNCGECEKCVRTMLILGVNGRLAEFPAFPNDGSLTARIESVDRIRPASSPIYLAALEKADDSELRAAVGRLMQRSGVPSPVADGG